MNNLLTERCNLLAENRNAVYKEFKWNNSLLAIASAMVFTNAGITRMLKKCEPANSFSNRIKVFFPTSEALRSLWF